MHLELTHIFYVAEEKKEEKKEESEEEEDDDMGFGKHLLSNTIFIAHLCICFRYMI